MSVDLTSAELRPVDSTNRRVSRRVARGERSRLARQERLVAQLAELWCIRSLVEDAAALVTSGWVQDGWFTVVDGLGKRRKATAHTIHAVAGGSVDGACLVGSIVHAAGGPPAAHTQLVQRTLDLTWHTLYNDEHEPVKWCPAPAIRTAHIRDLTRWNDQPGRTAAQVTSLLHSAMRTATTQTDLLHAH